MREELDCSFLNSSMFFFFEWIMEYMAILSESYALLKHEMVAMFNGKFSSTIAM